MGALRSDFYEPHRAASSDPAHRRASHALTRAVAIKVDVAHLALRRRTCSRKPPPGISSTRLHSLLIGERPIERRAG